MTHVRSCVVTAALLAVCVVGRQAWAGAHQFTGQGKWQSLTGGDLISGTWSLSLERLAANANVTGTMQVTGSNILKTATVNGTIDGNSVVLGVGSNGAASVSFNGKLAGRSISGEWDCPAAKDHGVWEGTLSIGQ